MNNWKLTYADGRTNIAVAASNIWENDPNVVDVEDLGPEPQPPQPEEGSYIPQDEDGVDAILQGIDPEAYANANVDPKLTRFFIKLDGAVGMLPTDPWVVKGLAVLEAAGHFTEASVLAAWPKVV